MFLYTIRKTKPVSETYVCEVAKFENIEFTLNFEGSENVQLKDGETKNKTQATVQISAFERVEVATALVRDPYQPTTLKVSYSISSLPFDGRTLLVLRTSDDSEVKTSTANCENLDLGHHYRTPKALHSILKEFSIMFLDRSFKPCLIPNFCEKENYLEQFPVPIVWRRAHYFMEEDYQVFRRGRELQPIVNTRDLRRSVLDTAWIISALACLGERPDVLDSKVFRVQSRTPFSNRNGSTGLFHLCLYVGGIPRTLVVDDFFPCAPNAGPIGVRSHRNELWASLCEKACAKQYGSYRRLERGWVSEALASLTGCPTSVYYFHENNRSNLTLTWEETKDSFRNGALMAFSAAGEDPWTAPRTKRNAVLNNGLRRGYSYPVIKVVETRFKQKLICLRNAWSKEPWRGKYAPGKSVWDEDNVRAETDMPSTGLCGNEENTFWVTFEEVFQNFASLSICRISARANKIWREFRRRGFFSYDVTSRDLNSRVQTNLYLLELASEADVWISLQQSSSRSKAHALFGMIDFGLTVLTLGDTGTYEVVQDAYTGCAVVRDQMLKLHLQAGRYVVVPVSTGTKFAARAGRVERSRKGSTSSLRKNSSRGDFVSNAQKTNLCLEEMFERLDADMDEVLNREELDAFMLVSEGKHLEDNAFEWLQNNFAFHNGGLTREGFLSLYSYLLDSCNGDTKVILKDLQFMGYNDFLELEHACTYTLSLHYESETEIAVSKQDFDPEAYSAALQLPILGYGDYEALGDDSGLRLYQLKATTGWGVSFMIENTSDRTYVAKMDCHGSQNVDTHNGKLEKTLSVPGKQSRIVQHIVPRVIAPWNWSYRMEWESTTFMNRS